MVVPTVAFAVPAIAALVKGGGTGVLTTALGTFGRARAPRLPKGDVGRALQGIVDLQARGLEPVLSKDPFTGGFVLSTADQSDVLQEILFERSAPKTSPEEIAEIRAFRQAFIDIGRTRGLVDPRVGPPTEPTIAVTIPPETTTRVTARLVSPGVVARGNASPRATSRRLMGRLAGPCAGPQTGITRLRCARGGLA